MSGQNVSCSSLKPGLAWSQVEKSSTWAMLFSATHLTPWILLSCFWEHPQMKGNSTHMHWGLRLGELVHMDMKTEEHLLLGVTSSGKRVACHHTASNLARPEQLAISSACKTQSLSYPSYQTAGHWGLNSCQIHSGALQSSWQAQGGSKRLFTQHCDQTRKTANHYECKVETSTLYNKFS